MRRSGPAPFVGSEPRKKLRQTDISGTVARSWKTVAMPRSFASRGLAKCVSSPSTSSSPSSWRCTPERILMNVDLPAPLSPSTHVTSPAPTHTLMSLRATTLPKYFDDARGPRAAAVIAGPLRALADVVVDQHRDQQDHAEEQEAPVGVPARELDADERHADDRRAQRRADRGAEAARQHAAADDRGDDVLELLADALAGLRGRQPQRDHDARQRAHERRGHEQPDLHARDRHADVAGGVRVTADAEDPVARRGCA